MRRGCLGPRTSDWEVTKGPTHRAGGEARLGQTRVVRGEPAIPTPYPVRVEATLDEPLNRGLWLVKWLLAIPHYVVLVFLWVAFWVVSVVAFFAILFTGRYPRALFNFNVGVLRWSWRVAYYSYAALGTDRYPPFTLDEVPDYPAHLEIPYPEQLSRGLVLVKWWLLAIPHYLVVSVFAGGGIWAAQRAGNGDLAGNPSTVGGGLIGLLVLIAAIVLLFRGRYPRPLFDFILGMNRWVLRVATYASLMTDVYPPFRMDMGGQEPPPAPAPDTAPAPAPAVTSGPEPGPMTSPQQPGTQSTSSWSAGRWVALVLGSLITLVALTAMTGGVAALLANQLGRDSDGYVTSRSATMSSSTYAVASDAVELYGTAEPDWPYVSRLIGNVRVRITPQASSSPMFVGIASATDASRYLSGVEHDTIQQISRGSVRTRFHPGEAPASPPGDLPIWVAQESGTGPLSLEWPVEDGSWTVVVMNSDGSADVAATVDMGATAPVLDSLWILLLVGGGLLLLPGALVIILAVALRSGPRPAQTGVPQARR